MLRGEAKRLAEIMVRTTVFKQFCKDKEKLEQRAQKLQEELKLDSDNIEKLKELAIETIRNLLSKSKKPLRERSGLSIKIGFWVYCLIKRFTAD